MARRDPVDRMLGYLKHYFAASSPDPEFSLAIQGGSSGSRLTHNHERQFNFVLQVGPVFARPANAQAFELTVCVRE